MIDLKVSTARAILNYADMLEEHKYYEDAFKVPCACVMCVVCASILSPYVGKLWWVGVLRWSMDFHGSPFTDPVRSFAQVYEKGVAHFSFPAAMEIWVVYLTKFIRRYVRCLPYMHADVLCAPACGGPVSFL